MISFEIDPMRTREVSPYVFGHNLEHTRGAVTGGLSAQMLRNRKFAGKVGRYTGVAAHWFGIGEKALFQLTGHDLFQTSDAVYARHLGCERMHRIGELQSQDVQNLAEGQICGVGQGGLLLKAARRYEMRVAARAYAPVTLRVSLTDREGGTVYAETALSLSPGDFEVFSFPLVPSGDDGDGCLRLTFDTRGRVILGAVSMLPEGHFRGMRRDVVELLKAVGPSLLRWPGGNFSGEYRWMDGLLPVDQRGPLQAATEIETQPYSDGYDFHEIATDDFVALCREVGAEPLITVNQAWNTPEESAAWVEYCNGGPDTEYGKLRALRGSPEPYGVRFWALGNEMGYGHMEGPHGPEAYAELARPHVEAMLRVSPDLEFWSSGPYPSDEWAKSAAAALLPEVRTVSLHHYCSPDLDYSTPEKARETYLRVTGSDEEALRFLRDMRACLDAAAPGIRISFDEWNQWYAWFRPSCVGEGIFTAKMLHLFLTVSGPLNVPVCCYFQPVGEGAIRIGREDCRLTANGQMFAVMKAHRGGRLCEITGLSDRSAAATRKGDEMTLTLVNDSYDGEKTFRFPVCGEVLEACLWSSEDAAPHTEFTPGPLLLRREKDAAEAALPPHSAARITVRLDPAYREREV